MSGDTHNNREVVVREMTVDCYTAYICCREASLPVCQHVAARRRCRSVSARCSEASLQVCVSTLQRGVAAGLCQHVAARRRCRSVSARCSEASLQVCVSTLQRGVTAGLSARCSEASLQVCVSMLQRGVTAGLSARCGEASLQVCVSTLRRGVTAGLCQHATAAVSMRDAGHVSKVHTGETDLPFHSYHPSFCLNIFLLLLLLQRSTAVQVGSSVWLMPQNQLSGRGLLPSPTAWSPDQHHMAMLADVSRYILGRTEGRGLGFGQLVHTRTGKCLKCQSSSDGLSDHNALCAG